MATFMLKESTSSQKMATSMQEELCALIQPPKREDSFVIWRSWAIINFILGTAAREATVCEMQIVLLLGGEQNGSNMRRCRSLFLLPDGYFFRCR